MRERGILFSGPMVRALLAGKKTQTRRAVKPHRKMTGVPTSDTPPVSIQTSADGFVQVRILEIAPVYIPCPYGQPGDRLWVRETWAGDDLCGTVYRADHPTADLKAGDLDDGEQSIRQWRPSLLMPRWASRLTLAVESIRIERAQDISDADIEAEGVDAEAVRSLLLAATQKRRFEAWPPEDAARWGERGIERMEDLPRRELWRLAWTLINGRASWDTNPWVWVVSFRRLP